jgi:transcriptional regulator with XRE-family HTH domain
VNKPAPRTVWIRIKEALEEARLPATQVYVAKKLGVTQPAITLWNKPGGFPTLENSISLAEHLGVNVEWLLTERGPKRPLPQDATAQKLWDMWPRLTDGDRRELLGVASGMLRRPEEPAALREQRRA